MALVWIDVTNRLSTPVYLQTPGCPSFDNGWQGWSGFTPTSAKPFELVGGLWQIPEDNRPEVLCNPLEEGGPPAGSPYCRLGGILFDEPIQAQRLRVRYRLTEAMVAAAATDDHRLEPKILFSAGQLVPARGNEGLGSSVALLGFGTDFSDIQPDPAALFADIDQLAEVDTSADVEGDPQPAAGVFLFLGSCYIPEYMGTPHALAGTGTTQVPPFWLPPLQVWALVESDVSVFWTDFVNCRELP